MKNFIIKMKVQAPTYTMPNMPVKDIVECLSESGFNILAADITHPNTAYITRLYEGILGIFLEHRIPENLDESTSLILVYIHMKKFVERIGMGTFFLMDIIKPEAGRTVKILSGIVNFALFKESKRHLLTNIYRKREEIEMIIEETERHIEKSEQVLSQKREEKGQSLRQIKSILKDIAEKEAEIINYHRTQQAMAIETEEISKEQQKLNESISMEKCEIMNISQEITKLQAKIVKNPEQLKELLIAMKSQLSDEAEILKEYEKRISMLHNTINMFQKVTEDLKSLMCVVSLVGEYSRKYSETELQLKRLQNENGSLEVENKSKHAKKLLLEKKIGYIVEKMASLTAEDAVRMDGLRKEFEALREKHVKISEQREHAQQLIQQNNEEIKNLEKEIIELESAHQSRLSSIYNGLVQQKNFLSGYGEDIQKVFSGEYVL
ncbi:kinetochore protein Nuf2 [Nematocida ausubeli]|nr:kinetochore protein Nuf2 [Nematocida ausubeli]